MKKNKIFYSIIFTILVFLNNNCVEPYDIKPTTSENALIIKATITNEYKNQEIYLSKVFPLDSNGPSPESNAVVKIIDDNQNTYNFIETIPGKYISSNEFEAQPNINYQLFITTQEGKSYTTEPTQLTSITQIDNLYPSLEVDDLGFENITLFVDSYNPNGDSRYYRYEFEETYKIVAPKWNQYDLVVVQNSNSYTIEKQLKTREEKTCYNTVNSNSIIQKETTGFIEDRVTKFPVRILSKDNTIISHRYSILVKQYVQSLEAFTFYKTLNKLSGSESIFSQNQPGFFGGNIFSVDSPNDKVVGLFEVSSVSTKRIFINYQDFFPNQPLPPYFTECEPFAPTNKPEGGDLSDLAVTLNSGTVKYFRDNLEPNYTNPGPYLVVPVECGDCTKYGTNVKPTFWVD